MSLTKEQQIDAAFDRMIASLDHSIIATCGRITHGRGVLEELNQLEAENFRRDHQKCGSPELQAVSK